METELFGDTGAYASLGEKVMTRATTHSTGPYEMEHVRADCYAMYTNNPPAGAFRGFGVTQSALAVESMVAEHGMNLFYHSVDHRKRCCGVRKMEPLRRALSGLDAWITGLRREQSVTRTEVHAIEWDEANGLVKVNPLADWTRDQVWAYIRAHNVPYNALHDRGYPSIGCGPCTRAVQPDEHERSGRWWWEHPETKECGLHVK